MDVKKEELETLSSHIIKHACDIEDKINKKAIKEKEFQRLARIGLIIEDLFMNNSVEILINATWDDGMIMNFDREITSLQELLNWIDEVNE